MKTLNAGGKVVFGSTVDVEDLEARIAEIRRRIPPHSAKPAMLEELYELEELLEQTRRKQEDA